MRIILTMRLAYALWKKEKLAKQHEQLMKERQELQLAEKIAESWVDMATLPLRMQQIDLKHKLKAFTENNKP